MKALPQVVLQDIKKSSQHVHLNVKIYWIPPAIKWFFTTVATLVIVYKKSTTAIKASLFHSFAMYLLYTRCSYLLSWHSWLHFDNWSRYACPYNVGICYDAKEMMKRYFSLTITVALLRFVRYISLVYVCNSFFVNTSVTHSLLRVNGVKV